MHRSKHDRDEKKSKTTRVMHWLHGVPGKITRMIFNRPQRRGAHEWERKAVTTDPVFLDGVDLPPHGRKAHHTIPAKPIA